MAEGYALFSEVHEHPPAQISDSLTLFTELRKTLQKSEQTLGFGDLALPIPSEWIITAESNSRSAIALNANPTSSYL